MIVLATDLIHRTTKVAEVAMPLGTRTGTTVVANGGVREDADGCRLPNHLEFRDDR